MHRRTSSLRHLSYNVHRELPPLPHPPPPKKCRVEQIVLKAPGGNTVCICSTTFLSFAHYTVVENSNTSPWNLKNVCAEELAEKNIDIYEYVNILIFHLTTFRSLSSILCACIISIDGISVTRKELSPLTVLAYQFIKKLFRSTSLTFNVRIFFE